MRSLSPHRCRWFLLALLVSLAAATTVRADGLIRQLPADGAWVEYFTEVTVSGPQEAKFSGKLVLRSVGKATENAKPCRWIEFDLTLDVPDREEEFQFVAKLLVPEASIGSDQDLLANVVRAWVRTSDMDARLSENAATERGGLLRQFFGSPPQEPKQVDAERSFPWQRGTFTAKQGRTWQRELELEADQLAGTLDVTVWPAKPSKDVPFGTAAMTTKFDVKNVPDFDIQLELLLNDYGTDAQSVLPDQQ